MIRLMRGSVSELTKVDQLLTLAFGSPSRRNELELYTKVQPDGWFVIEEDDRIVAVGGCIVYGSFSWMGLVGTHPAVRGRGHATRLSEHLVKWSYAKGCRTVALDASKLGRPIYERLGFQPVGSTVRLARAPGHQQISPAGGPGGFGNQGSSARARFRNLWRESFRPPRDAHAWPQSFPPRDSTNCGPPERLSFCARPSHRPGRRRKPRNRSGSDPGRDGGLLARTDPVTVV